jgi:4-aminobutyrate aminotransferase-like enzyme
VLIARPIHYTHIYIVMSTSHSLVVLQVVYFVNSGTEANELAMLMARLYSGNLGMISLRNAYHGGSAGTIGLTGLQTWKYPIPQVRV